MISGFVRLKVLYFNQDNYNWKQIQPKGKEPIGRFGHTSVFYDKCLFIYGGGLKKNAALPNEGQELLIYNISKNIFNQGKTLYTMRVVEINLK